MKSLKEYIRNNETIDGHIHLFDHNGVIDTNLIKDYKCVCFADIVYKYKEKYKDSAIISYYDNFIKNHYNSSKHTLLATGTNAEDIITIYKKYPKIIKGFGELKCYSEYDGEILPYGNLEWIRPVLEFNKKLNLPVYIHFDLDTNQHKKEFEKLLKEYNTMPIVLCHCGLVHNETLNEDIHNFICELSIKYNNLYLDISEKKTRLFYIKNINKLLNLNPHKILIGSDINPHAKEKLDNYMQFCNECYNECEVLHSITNFKNAVYTLFKQRDN